MNGVLEKLDRLELVTAMDYLDLSEQSTDTGYSRTRPFTATMTVSITLCLLYHAFSSDKYVNDENNVYVSIICEDRKRLGHH